MKICLTFTPFMVYRDYNDLQKNLFTIVLYALLRRYNLKNFRTLVLKMAVDPELSF